MKKGICVLVVIMVVGIIAGMGMKIKNLNQEIEFINEKSNAKIEQLEVENEKLTDERNEYGHQVNMYKMMRR